MIQKTRVFMVMVMLECYRLVLILSRLKLFIRDLFQKSIKIPNFNNDSWGKFKKKK